MSRLPTYLDRYPAKMVSHLARKLIGRFALDAQLLLDCFCGSGAILQQASQVGLPVLGIDINPYAALLSGVKIQGFDAAGADRLCQNLLRWSERLSDLLPIEWEGKSFWFTRGTILKYERLRFAARELDLARTREGRALLLALALSARLCSRADQRSPKPFISRVARDTRRGRHFDPAKRLTELYSELRNLYGKRSRSRSAIICGDIVHPGVASEYVGRCSHLITSPPYINAQDYFRNFKLELAVLQGLVPFKLNDLKCRFIGTDRGDLCAAVTEDTRGRNRELLPELVLMEVSHPRHASVVHRYIADMASAFDTALSLLAPNCRIVVVCGDNLVGGYSIATWRVLNRLLEARGFVLQEMFGDEITCRVVPPQRRGHKGLIKREVISSFAARRDNL